MDHGGDAGDVDVLKMGANLHEWVARYNWDDGLAPIWPIVDWPRTEFATALMIYWRLEGPYLTEELTDREVAALQDEDAEAVRLQSLVRERLLAGFYRRGTSRFDPREQEYLSRVQIYKLRKAGVPDLLLGLEELEEPNGSTPPYVAPEQTPLA